MRRALIGVILAVAVLVAIVFGAGAGGGGGGDYKVRAIFDNASFLISGQDVKVAGGKVGVVDHLDVANAAGGRCTSGSCKAAVVLKITRNGFKDFRADAHCTIRLQSPIGEKLVDCLPTQPRTDGTPAPPSLKKIPKGQPGAGQYLLPLQNTSTPVDADLINNIQRRPYRERFSIILNELGAGLAARADDLRAVVRRANPALEQFDRFLNILANQNKMLRRLTRNGDVVVSALARERKHVSNFFVQSKIAGQATAEKSADLERNFEKFPAFLRQLTPFMNDFQLLSDQMDPVIANLRAAGPDLSRFLIALGPFSRATIPALRTLGNAADVGRPALIAAEPIARILNSFATKARSVTRNLASLLGSIQSHQGIERFVDLLYNLTLATNGFDEVGHFLRNDLVVTICSGYAITPTVGCSAKFAGGSSSAATTSSAGSTRRLLDAIVGPQHKRRQKTSSGSAGTQPASQKAPAQPSPQPKQGASSPTATAPKAPPSAGNGKGGDALLNYLLGGSQ